jgi:imidazolonepropionase-like amidohydrolase
LVIGGFSPTEALITATHNPATMLGLDIGHIAIGSIADLLIVDGNPLSDITALQHLRYSIRAGEARRPMDWLKEPIFGEPHTQTF